MLNRMKPVYVINGFLESGKTEFISFTLAQPYFQIKGKTLLIVCEEGENEYDAALLKKSRTELELIEEEADFTPENLTALEKKHKPERIIIEYNGMWNYKNAKKEMEELTGLHAKLGNDANVAALGEMWKGAGAGFRNMIMVTLGTGVGGGIIVDGKVVAGTHGAGGEIGHLCVNYREMATCGCGNRGCLEQYASATGIVRMAKKKIRELNVIIVDKIMLLIRRPTALVHCGII